MLIWRQAGAAAQRTANISGDGSRRSHICVKIAGTSFDTDVFLAARRDVVGGPTLPGASGRSWAVESRLGVAGRANARPMTGSAQSWAPSVLRKSRSSLRSVRATGLHPRHCEEHLRRSNPPFFVADEKLDCFAEPVIGRRFAPTRWLAMTGIERGLRQSQEALRIDVDLELEIAFCLRPRGEPFA